VNGLESTRILHLFANYKWTGPADPAIRCASRLRALGLDVTFAQASFVHRGGEHRMRQELWNARLPVVAGLELRKHLHIRSFLRDVTVLRHLLHRDRFGLVHCHMSADHLMAALANRRLERPPPIVRTLYDPEPPRRGMRERIAFARSAGIVAPTSTVAVGVRERFQVPESHLLVQEPVTEPRDRRGPGLRARWGLGPEHRLVGITARIQPHRRFDLLWDIAAQLCVELPTARFVLLGRGNDRDTKKLVTDPVRARGLQDRVVLPGYLEEPDYSAALRSLDAFLFLVPGSDGTCRAVREAMAFGLPVVAPRRGILPELLRPRRVGEEFGLVCDEAPVAMAAALLRLLHDDRLRGQFGAAALRSAQIDLDPDAAARSLAGFYERLLAEAR